MSTALELTRDGWKDYLQGSRRRTPAQEMTASEKRERESLRRRVRKAAGVLKTQFGARRVILFGSLAGSRWYGPASDVDLAVEGLETGKAYWQAWSAVEEILQDRSVDLVDLGEASKSLRKAIQDYGIEL